MATTIAQKFAALGTSIINLVGTRATVNMDNLTTAGINKIAEYGGGGGVAKTAMSNVLLSVASASSSVSGTAPNYTVKVSGTFKGMIPNGRYPADGTLKSTETTVTLSNTTVYLSRTKTLYAWGSDSSIRIYADVATLTEDSPLFTSDGNHYEGDAKYVIDAANNQIQYTSADGSTTSTLSYYSAGNVTVSADKGDVLYVFTDASGNIDCHPYTISFNQPAGAGNDDVWYDMKNNYLKRYSSSQSQWNTYSAFLIAELHVDYHGEPICHLEEPVQILDGGVLIDKIEEAQVPTGTVIAYMGTDVPEGFMQMDGRTLSRNTYAKLFSVIGTTQGAGDGSTTFQIADMTDGRYLMGSTVAGSSAHEIPWNQPYQSSSWVLGGANFCSAVLYNTGVTYYWTYKFFDSSPTGGDYVQKDSVKRFILYNPEPFKITNINITAQNDNVSFGIAGNIFISHNNISGERIGSWSRESGSGYAANWNIDMSWNKIYAKYYWFEVSTYEYNAWGCANINITAVTRENGTADYYNAWAAKAQSQYYLKY